MKIVIDTNGALTECRVTGYSYENPTVPMYNELLEECDESTKARVMDALREVLRKCGRDG